MLGSPGANIAESEMTTASAFSRAAFASMKGARCSLPTSSSPSASTITFTGSLPRDLRCASSAFTCRNSCPLSSTEPRANSLPSRTTGSNAGDVHNSSGSAGCTS